jgi:hypothetical protein
MKDLGEIELELSRLGIRNRFFGKPEVRELANVLTDDETIIQAANGRYHGGLALIVATNHRLLLIDKKMMFMSIEDIRFDMITELDFSARLLNATINVRTINKVLNFTSVRQPNLRKLCHYLQERIMELRHMMLQQSQMPELGAAYQAPNQFVAVPQMVQTQLPQQQPVEQPPLNTVEQKNYSIEGAAESPQLVSQMTPSAPDSVQLQNQTATQQPYGTYINYNRPSRLRRMGAFPTASLTTQHQRFNTLRR